jgi:hypothetical protein
MVKGEREWRRRSGKVDDGDIGRWKVEGGWIGPLRGSPPTSRYCPPSNFGGFGSAAIERVCVNPIPGFGETDGLRLSAPMKTGL